MTEPYERDGITHACDPHAGQFGTDQPAGLADHELTPEQSAIRAAIVAALAELGTHGFASVEARVTAVIEAAAPVGVLRVTYVTCRRVPAAPLFGEVIHRARAAPRSPFGARGTRPR